MGKMHDGSPRAGLHFAWLDEKIVGIQVTEQLQAERDEYFAKQLEKIRAIAVSRAFLYGRGKRRSL
jgi:hypothetical protein